MLLLFLRSFVVRSLAFLAATTHAPHTSPSTPIRPSLARPARYPVRSCVSHSLPAICSGGPVGCSPGRAYPSLRDPNPNPHIPAGAINTTIHRQPGHHHLRARYAICTIDDRPGHRRPHMQSCLSSSLPDVGEMPSAFEWRLGRGTSPESMRSPTVRLKKPRPISLRNGRPDAGPGVSG
ncbi:hypothetical protein BV20DRAFT_305496 [Pilatotrama ljubarskyi]|nr:hypothetical protein BV20DRAFT_305496 [Pilatotrama ljubarskyi]